MPALAAAPIALSMLATFLIASQDGTFTVDPAGLGLVILSILLNVVGVTINSWYGSGESPMARSAATNILGAVLLAPVLIASHSGPAAQPIDWSIIGMAIFIAATSGTLAKALYLYSATTLPSPLLFASSSLALVVTATTGWIILGQALTWVGIVGVIVGAISTILLAYTTTRIRTTK
jgi:drug/metabolite transporter (DMT)-like permease